MDYPSRMQANPQFVRTVLILGIVGVGVVVGLASVRESMTQYKNESHKNKFRRKKQSRPRTPGGTYAMNTASMRTFVGRSYLAERVKDRAGNSALLYRRVVPDGDGDDGPVDGPVDGDAIEVRLQESFDPDIWKVGRPHRLPFESEIRDEILRVRRDASVRAWATSSPTKSEIGDDANIEEVDTSLYSRRWIALSPRNDDGGGGSSGDGCNEPASTKTVRTPSSESSSFTVAQFNTLAEGLSSGPSGVFPTPFAIDGEDPNAYGGFIGVPRPDVALDFDHFRKWRLLEVLLGGGVVREASSDDLLGDREPCFDILAIEEVDHYEDFFKPLLVGEEKEGEEAKEASGIGSFNGVFEPKPNSPGVKFGYYSDGAALLWNTAKFQVVDAEWIEKGAYTGEDFDGAAPSSSSPSSSAEGRSNQVYILVPLRHLPTGKLLVVAATHLKARKGIKNAKVREGQAKELRFRAERMADALGTSRLGAGGGGNAADGEDVGVLILGDMNAEPDEPAVRNVLLREGDPSTEESLSSSSKWQFHSAYPLESGECHDFYTTYKTRRNGTTRRVIDYIFYSSKRRGSSDDNVGERTLLRCSHILSVPSEDEMEEGFLPGLRYPSDHLLVAAMFTL